MRVLYLCHRVPYPPNKGDKIRAFHELQAIAARHEVDLFTLADCAGDLKAQKPLHQYCRYVDIVPLNPTWARLRTLPLIVTQQPLSVSYFYSAELDRQIRKATIHRSYDRIFVYCSSMAQYVRGVYDVPTLMDIVDVDSDKWVQYAPFKRFPLSAVYRREGQSLQKYEKTLYSRFPVLVSTEREAQIVRQASPKSNVHVIPNGVDTAYFDRGQSAASQQPTMIFVGDMAYFPNEEAVTFFVLSVFPSIRSSFPDARFLIVGRDPGPNVRRLAKVRGVTVTGSVADVRPYLEQAQISVAPFSIATGIQNKILEAMAYGLPVVATPRAVQGLSKRVADAIQIGETPAELASQVIGLLRNPEAALEKAAEGRQRVTAEHNWERSMNCVLDLLETCGCAQVSRAEILAPSI